MPHESTIAENISQAAIRRTGPLDLPRALEAEDCNFLFRRQTPAHEKRSPEPLSAGRHALIWLAGIFVGDIAVGLQFAATILLTDKLRFARQLGIPSLFLVPVLGGFIASYIWRTLKPSIGFTFLNTLWMTLLA